MPRPIQRWRVEHASVTDHSAIVRVAKQSPYTKDFTSPSFSSPDHYGRGEVLVARRSDKVFGFLAFHVQRFHPICRIYFCGVDEQVRRQGVGSELVNRLFETCPATIYKLRVMRDNPAVLFWQRLGWQEDPDEILSYLNQALAMRLYRA